MTAATSPPPRRAALLQSDLLTAMNRLPGQPLARHVADEEEQAVGVEQEEVVEVAADLAGRLEERVEIEARVAGEGRRRVGQAAHLDAPRRLQLARQPGGRLALLLDLAAERPALALGLGQGDARASP